MPCSMSSRTHHLVGEPGVRADQAPVGDLVPEHLDVLGHSRGQSFPEGWVAVEPFQFVVGTGHLKRVPGDLRGPRQRGDRARVEQPGAAPHQCHQEQLGHRVEVDREQRRLGVGPGAVRPHAPAVVAAGDDHRQRPPLVQHRPGSDEHRPRAHEPAAGGLVALLHPGQPDPVAVALGVERVGAADVGDPRARGHGADHPGTPRKPPPRGDRQVRVRPPAEHQPAALGDPHDQAGGRGDARGGRVAGLRGRHRLPVCGNRHGCGSASVGPGARQGRSRNPGMASGRRPGLATGKPGARHGMACLEGLPLARKAARRAAGAGAGKERTRGFAPCAFLGGTRGTGTCLAPGRCVPAPLRPMCVHSAGSHTAGEVP